MVSSRNLWTKLLHSVVARKASELPLMATLKEIPSLELIAQRFAEKGEKGERKGSLLLSIKFTQCSAEREIARLTESLDRN